MAQGDKKLRYNTTNSEERGSARLETAWPQSIPVPLFCRRLTMSSHKTLTESSTGRLEVDFKVKLL